MMLSSTRSILARLLLPCLILSALSGCVTASTVPVPIDSYCAIARPMAYDSLKDTPETVEAIENHNSQWVCVCESDCPNPPPPQR